MTLGILKCNFHPNFQLDLENIIFSSWGGGGGEDHLCQVGVTGHFLAHKSLFFRGQCRVLHISLSTRLASERHKKWKELNYA